MVLFCIVLFISLVFLHTSCESQTPTEKTSSTSPSSPSFLKEKSDLTAFWTRKKIEIETQLRSIDTLDGDSRRELLSSYLECLHVLQLLQQPETVSLKNHSDLNAVREQILRYQFLNDLPSLLRESAEENDIDRATVLLLTARQFELSRRFSDAIRIYTSILQDSEYTFLHAHIRHLSALAHLQNGHRKAAQKDLELILKNHGNYLWSSRVRKQLAELYLDQNAFEDALTILSNIRSEADILWLKSLAYRGLNKSRTELKMLKSLWIRFPACRYTDKVEHRLKQLCKDLKRSWPDIGRSDLFSRAKTLDKAGLRNKAAEEFYRLIESKIHDEIDAKSRLFLARIYHDTRQNDKALSLYKDFITRYPKHASIPTVLFRMGTIYRRLDDTKQFLSVTDEIIRRHRSSSRWADALFRRGEYFKGCGHLKKALRDFRRAAAGGGEIKNIATWKQAWILFDLKRYREAEKLFNSLYMNEKGTEWEPAALYWRGVCRKKSGKALLAKKDFQKVSEQFPWHYAGQSFLRYSGSANGGELFWEPEPEPVLSKPMMSDPSLRRALVLEKAGYFKRAAVEWEHLFRGSKNTKVVAVHYATALFRSGHPLKARRVLLRKFNEQRLKGTLPVSVAHLLYPIPQDIKQDLFSTAKKHGLDPFLVTALILQESGFDPSALSNNLAVGYMQVTPSLYRKLKPTSAKDPLLALFHPVCNIDTGMTYLSMLLERYQGKLPYALAAYNAGEHRVDLWKSQFSSTDDETWTEHIPFRQTRLFVKKILENYMCYRRIYKNEFNS